MKAHIASSLSLFERGCQRARGMRSMFDYLKKTAPAALDCNDTLRSALVLAVSSFDLYVHDIFRLEVTHRLHAGQDVPSLRIPFNVLSLDRNMQAISIEECVRRENAYKSFVAPDKLAECLRHFTDNPWERIAQAHGCKAAECKSKLKSVVALRNRIAHEADVNPAYGGIDLWPIYAEDVGESISFLEKLGKSIAKAIEVC